MKHDCFHVSKISTCLHDDAVDDDNNVAADEYDVAEDV